MALTKRKIQVIKSELIADAIVDVLEKQGYFDSWVQGDKTEKDGNVYIKWAKVNSSIIALDELRHLIIKEIDEII